MALKIGDGYDVSMKDDTMVAALVKPRFANMACGIVTAMQRAITNYKDCRLTVKDQQETESRYYTD